MNINDSIKKTSLPEVAQPLTQARTSERANISTKNTAISTKTSEDSVQLSSQYQATVNDQESFDAEKVEQIKSAIASGKYTINPEKIASGILNTVQDLLNAKK